VTCCARPTTPTRETDRRADRPHPLLILTLGVSTLVVNALVPRRSDQLQLGFRVVLPAGYER
jgi:hypothetical protein